ncbi:sulfatase-like hydrolase/transferase [Candidatus Bathyarchaeota archaeon]|nr:sulfatase-like hydrolase/transferase [Candidatus Bathyarchaeota archaeon]
MANQNRPNILIITVDQLYAHPQKPEGLSFPNIERLEAEGVKFVNHQITTTVCTPSRSVMVTGQHTPHTKMFDNTNFAWIEPMAADAEKLPTMGHMLHELGYYAAYMGKWHLSIWPHEGTTKKMEAYGFSDYQDWGDRHGDPRGGHKHDPIFADEAISWLRTKAPEIAKTQPWLLAVNFINPHDIMYFDTDAEEPAHKPGGLFPIVPAPDTELYRKKWNVKLPPSFEDDLSNHPPAVKDYQRDVDSMQGYIPRGRRDLYEAHINYYLNCIRAVDIEIGRVLDALEEIGQKDNTIVIFTSDHGEMAAAHKLTQKGGIIFKEVANVPFIVVDPRGQGGKTTKAVTSHLDLVPTVLALAGFSEQELHKRYPALKGHDLSSLWANPDSDGPRGSPQNPGKGALFTFDMIATIDTDWLIKHGARLLDVAAAQAGTEMVRGEKFYHKVLKEVGHPDAKRREMVRGVFDGRYKLVRYFGLDNYHIPETVEELFANNDVALYDLVNDPDEMNNLANLDNPDYNKELLATMNTKLNNLIQHEIGEDKQLFKLPEDLTK